MLRVLDLFSGIGGFSLGLERTGGFKTAAFCEIEPYCQKVLARHWPGVRCYPDVTQLSSQHLTADGISVDVICGGFPCQDISVAGLREGIGGPRSGLWRQMARIVGEVRPRFVVVENVAGLLDRGLGDVLGDLAAIGYDAEWHCISASDLGAPHTRERVWVVAYPSGERSGQLRWGECAEKGAAAWGIYWPKCQPPRERVVDGISDRLHRLTALGNGIVPQIPELIGRAILEVASND